MKIIKKDKTYFINYNKDEDTSVLNEILDSNLDIKRITKDVYSIVLDRNLDYINKSRDVIILKKEELIKPEFHNVDLIKSKILSFLNDKSISGADLIEGNSEKLLKKEDLPVFLEMLKKKEVTIFHLPKYKKGIYKANTSIPEVFVSSKVEDKKPGFVSASKIDVEDDTTSSYEANLYVIIKNQGDAVFFSEKYGDRIKSGEIIGQKSFDGNYYVIDSDNYQKIKEKIIALKFKDAFNIEDIKLKLNYPEDEIKVVLEILKEECLVIEKRKGNYLLV